MYKARSEGDEREGSVRCLDAVKHAFLCACGAVNIESGARVNNKVPFCLFFHWNGLKYLRV